MTTPAYEIIDCHIHPVVDPATNTFWMPQKDDLQTQFEALQRAGITRACGTPIRPMQPSQFAEVRALNDQALALRDRFPKLYIPGIHIHPHFPQESCAEVARCCGREGVRWIGELVGYILGFGNEYATPEALLIFHEAGKHKAAVNFHCDDPEVIQRLCLEVPEVNFVLAHPGSGRDDIQKRVSLTSRFPNLHLDISGSGIDRLGILRKAIDLAGREKLLFGSDFPINNPAVYVHGALFEQLSREEYTALFSGNFKRLCGM